MMQVLEEYRKREWELHRLVGRAVEAGAVEDRRMTQVHGRPRDYHAILTAFLQARIEATTWDPPRGSG